ncbi:MAG: TauD/TfdA family dioxygenase [Devosiaceae bacterium]|nr:TauD/TfdA family dioxygenase [Devosiaceae bacterium MH13]
MDGLSQRPFEPIEQVSLDPAVIRQRLADLGVVKLAEPLPSAQAFYALIEALGTPMFTQGETPVEGLPMLNVVSNVGRKVPPRSVFHTDTSYVPRPPAYSALYAVDVPQQGGATLFTNQFEAAEALPARVREALMDAAVLHVATGVEDATQTWHPLFRKHPDSKRFALYLSSVARMKRLKPRANAGDRTGLLPLLYRRSIRRHLKHRHVWRPGDVVIWDNRCTLHAADHSDVVGRRVLYRGMVQGETPYWG